MILSLLRNWSELSSVEAEGALLEMRLDLERALVSCPLTEEELRVVRSILSSEVDPPQRTSTVGRPRGGRTDWRISQEIYADKTNRGASVEFSRRLATAALKISEYLGEGYVD